MHKIMRFSALIYFLSQARDLSPIVLLLCDSIELHIETGAAKAFKETLCHGVCKYE